MLEDAVTFGIALRDGRRKKVFWRNQSVLMIMLLDHVCLLVFDKPKRNSDNSHHLLPGPPFTNMV